MTDKEKIKKEIERQIEEGKVKCQQSQENNDRESFVAWSEHVATCGQLLVFIDTLQEEPKCIYNRTLEERKKFCKYCSAFCTVRIKEEPVSEDLDEEIGNYIKDNFFGSGSIGLLSNRTKGELDSVDVANIARHFAEWQHGKDFDDLLQSEMKFPKEFYEKGRFDMREEMMKDAMEAERLPKNKGWVAKNYDGTIRLFFLCPPQRIDDKRYKYWYGGPNASKQLSNDSFPDLKWEDEPIEVELTIKKI